ncbi:MAG: undecaprenyl-phosphate glucose phosphotransferase [Sedimenticola sp.]
MVEGQIANKQLLTRRDSVFSSIQSSLDGAYVIGLLYYLAVYNEGALSFRHLFFFLLLLGAMGLSYDRYGIYRKQQYSITNQAIALGQAWSVAFGVLLVIGYFLETLEIFPRQALIITYFAGYFGQFLLHILLYRFQRKVKENQDKNNALIIGEGMVARYLYDKINGNPWINEKVIGRISLSSEELDNTKAAAQGKGEDIGEGIKVLGNLNNVTGIVKEHQIHTVYIVTPLDASPLIAPIYYELLDRNVDIHWVPNIFALKLINHSVKEISGIPLITLSETPLLGSSLLMKTVLDRVLALIAFIVVSPIFLATAVAIKAGSPGPVFFRQQRTGWNGEVFSIYKFRSMRVHKEDSDVITQATREDPRITPVGRFIRRTSIDELPQLLNVLNGTMSMVGPRPHAVSHDNEYSKRISSYMARHRIKPGITGLAQVRGYRGETNELDLMVKRVESDIEYIDNWSVWLDLSVLARTVFVVIGKDVY